MTGLVLANPGAIAELPMMAAALARAGMLRAYVAPFGGPRGAGRDARLERVLPPLLARELRRRRVADCVRSEQIVHVATALEAAAVIAARTPFLRPLASPLQSARNAAFDRNVARLVRRSDHGVIAVSGAGRETLRVARALDVPAFLECPIAHPDHIERMLTDEARREPDFAPTLQLHRLPPGLRLRQREEFALADTLLVLSSYQRWTFLEAGFPEGKLAVTPLGVDVETFRPQPRPEGRAFRVVFVGQITQRKGLSYLLRAFKHARIPGSELVLAGRIVGTSAPWRGARDVRHVPHVPRWDLPTLYRTADVFVLPSLVEGFGLTALEAMASGIPVILSTNTFADDVVTDGVDGFIVPIRDAEAIAERLRLLHADADLRARMGNAAAETARRFTWLHYGEQLVAAVTRARLGLNMLEGARA